MQKSSDTVSRPFLGWRSRLNLSRTDAAKLLGRTERQIQTYDAEADPSHMLKLAMAALEFLPSWRLADLGIQPTWRKQK